MSYDILLVIWKQLNPSKLNLIYYNKSVRW